MHSASPFRISRILTIRQRLILGMLLITVPLLAISVSGYLLLKVALDSQEEIHEEVFKELAPVMDLQSLLLRAQMPANDYLIHGRADERDKFEALRQAIEREFEAALQAPFGLRENSRLVADAQALWKSAHALSDSIFSLEQPIGNSKGAEMMIRMDAQFYQAHGRLQRVIENGRDELASLHTLVHTLHREAGLLISLMLIIVTIVAVVGVFLLRSWIVAPLAELCQGAMRLGAGELDYRIPVVADDEIGSVAAAFNNMADQLKHERDLLFSMASHDLLTGLLNLREFHRILDIEHSRSQRHGRGYAILMFDLDFFKLVNDNYGHPAGDTVLRIIAERTLDSIRPVDTAARYGGEEFIVLLPETDTDGAMATAERLRGKIGSSPLQAAPDQLITVTVSIGVSVYPADADNTMSLIAVADKALYAAKAAGRNRVCLYADIDPKQGG
jgi:diguanylate cyclase (GGDEF)-like protein